MLIREGSARSFAVDRRLACGLALIAGSLNSAGFYAVGFFSANMTGNVSTMADRVALGDVLTGLFYLAIVGTFIFGAGLSALITSMGKRHRIYRIYAVSIMAEAVLMTGLGCADMWLPAITRGPVVVFGLSFLMGFQNAIVTRISNARVRTTHISGMATDVGIELGCLMDIAIRKGGMEDAKPYRDRLGLHSVTILSFCTGGVLGVVAYRAVGAWFLFGAASALLSLSVPGFLSRERVFLTGQTDPVT